MKTLKAIRSAFGVAFAAFVGSMFIIHGAEAGQKIGNGGGAWVCREPGGTIRWSKLVDLFEATDEFGLTLVQYPGSAGEVVEKVRSRIFSAHQDLFNALAPYLHQLNNLESNPPFVTYTGHIVQTIDDSLYRLKPSPNDCVGGTVAYEQVVNYKQDGYILVESELFNSFSSNIKAALILHEAIYKYRRDVAGDTDSVVTRRMVGLIFSNLSTEELKKQLGDLGEREIGALGMRFSLIQPGTFVMGSSSGEYGQLPFEKEPQHRVTLTQPFEMQTTTVTQSQYTQVMGVNPSFFRKPEDCKTTFEVRQKIAMCPNHPVESVSYGDVLSFIAKLNGMHRDEYVYRLPTEAEWEYATRGGTTTTYFFGNDFFGKDKRLFSYYGWFDQNSELRTHEVAQLRPNSFGLYDMLGNVSQWVSDWFGEYGTAAVTDPSGPSSGAYRVARPGGCVGNGTLGNFSWNRSASSERSAARGSANPDSHQYCMGFRLVRTPR